VNPKTQTVLGVLVALLLLAGGSYGIYRDIGMPSQPQVSDGEPSVAPNGQAATLAVADSTDDVAAVLDVPQPIPDLNRAVQFSADFPAETRPLLLEKVNVLTTKLKETPIDFGSWIELGIRYKQAGDYGGAKIYWEYATRLQPENSLSYLNLGILYHYHLKDVVKAEQNLLTSLKHNPVYPTTYGELHDLYRYSYKQDTTAAVDILKEGLGKTENNINLLLKLAQYYRDEKNDIANAKKYFEEARQAALSAGNTALAATLEQEINALH
jgi:cytochrome c-type biogenesis protein CcmH/NrfG